MKLSFSVKLTIAVIVFFGLVILGMIFYRPVKVKYYAARLRSDDVKVRQSAARILLGMNEKEPVFEYYTEKYKSDKVEDRMGVVDELCAVGDKGKAVMKEIFRKRCFSEQVKISAGSIVMTDTYILNSGPHTDYKKVTLPEFYMDKYEVTAEKYMVFYKCCAHEYMNKFEPEKNGGYFTPVGPSQDSFYLEPSQDGDLRLPAVYITWNNAKRFTEWLGIRLPTEAEWEYASLAGARLKFYRYCFGDNESLMGEYAWYNENSGGKPHIVGKKKPNKWGLYDMYGNIEEWCADDCGTTSPGGMKLRVLRGGSYSIKMQSFRDGHRVIGSSSELNADDGFRCVRDPERN